MESTLSPSSTRDLSCPLGGTSELTLDRLLCSRERETVAIKIIPNHTVHRVVLQKSIGKE